MSEAAARAMIKTNDTEPNDIKLCRAKTRSGRPSKSTLLLAERDAGCTADRRQVLGTPEGKAAYVVAHWKHGQRSKASVEARKQIWAELRRVESPMRALGLID